MKTYSITFILFFLAISLTFVACEKNDQLPNYELLGTSTATIVEIDFPKDTVAQGEQVDVTFTYVNLTEDPIKSAQLLTKPDVEGADFTELTTLDQTSAPVDKEVTFTYTYTAPNVPDSTNVDIDMVLTSQKQFPQRERTSFVVSAPKAVQP